MKAICVDDEAAALEKTVSVCRKLPELEDVRGFAAPDAALQWAESHAVDLALLDIEMPGINGIALAGRIRELHPEAAVIFVTGHARYALDAFAVHASGYLLKPVSESRLVSEISYALGRKGKEAVPVPAAIFAHTFGQFDLYVNGKTVAFERSRAKELLALLIDRRGGSMTRPEIFAVLWEDAPYDRSAQKQLDVIIRSLRKTLAASQAGQIVEMKSAALRVVPQELECDMYRLLAGDDQALNAYRGEYMSSYSWASMTESDLDRRVR